MADTLTTTTQVDPAVEVYYDRVLLMAGVQNNVHLRWAQHARLDKRNGNTYKWRRYTNLTVATTPLVEASNPPGQQGSKTDLTVQVQWYGDFVHITDVIDLTVQDAVLNIFTDKIGIQQKDTFDTLMRDILAACASQGNASGGGNGSTPTELTRADIDDTVLTLLGNKAKMIDTMRKAGTGQGTSPVRAAFRCVVNTALLDDLEDCTGFKSVAEYPSDNSDITEWGSIGNTRWHFSTNGHLTTDSPVQYYIPFIGQEAYGDVALLGKHDSEDNYTSEVIIHQFGSAGVSDALNRKASVGWKAVWAARILNDNYIYVLRVTHS